MPDRGILFRGKRLSSGGWIYGNLVRTDNGIYIIQNYVPMHMLTKCEVDPSTVSQYTGRTDKNGTRIFEGDVVKTSKYGRDDGDGHNFAGFDTFQVAFGDGGYHLLNGWRRFNLRPDEGLEVIGNRWDNPELMGGEQNE